MSSKIKVLKLYARFFIHQNNYLNKIKLIRIKKNI